MRVFQPLALATLAAALPLAAQSRDHTQPEPQAQAASGAGGIPAGWTVRADGKADAAEARIAAMGGGIHVTTGPALILYRPDTRGTGPFHTLATFTQTKPSAHPEGYGLFFGGQGLEDAGQKYIYFLVRQDGAYLIKRRDGAKTSDISKGWVTHSAVKRPDAKGGATNLLEVDNKVDPSKLTFKVNGQDVHSMDSAGLELDGVVGIRANHNLDLHIEGFDVHR
ncbi:MAG TPA: hypothetical protein VFZ26_04225 [Gemmatimonadales bacterium]